MRTYIGSGLLEDNSPMSYVCQLYYDCLGQGAGFKWKIRSVRVVPNADSISTYPIYKI
jgi:hypothetical protein